jgi:hypothetical protein
MFSCYVCCSRAAARIPCVSNTTGLDVQLLMDMIHCCTLISERKLATTWHSFFCLQCNLIKLSFDVIILFILYRVLLPFWFIPYYVTGCFYRFLNFSSRTRNVFCLSFLEIFCRCSVYNGDNDDVIRCCWGNIDLTVSRVWRKISRKTKNARQTDMGEPIRHPSLTLEPEEHLIILYNINL